MSGSKPPELKYVFVELFLRRGLTGPIQFMDSLFAAHTYIQVQGCKLKELSFSYHPYSATIGSADHDKPSNVLFM